MWLLGLLVCNVVVCVFVPGLWGFLGFLVYGLVLIYNGVFFGGWVGVLGYLGGCFCGLVWGFVLFFCFIFLFLFRFSGVFLRLFLGVVFTPFCGLFWGLLGPVVGGFYLLIFMVGLVGAGPVVVICVPVRTSGPHWRLVAP